MQMIMKALPKPGDRLSPQFYGDSVQVRANMGDTTYTGTLIAEGKPSPCPSWQDYREYSDEISAPVHALISVLCEHFGCVDDRDKTERGKVA